MVSPGLLELSPTASEALFDAIESIRHLTTSPAEGIALLLDVVMPLTKHEQLTARDHEVLLAFCQDDDRLLNLAQWVWR